MPANKLDEKDITIGEQRSTINHLQFRIDKLEEDHLVLAAIEDTVDRLIIGGRLNDDDEALKSMKNIENVITDWHDSMLADVDRVHIRADIDDITVMVTYPAYTIGNSGAIERAIVALHRVR